jgi:cold shock CspA family protein
MGKSQETFNKKEKEKKKAKKRQDKLAKKEERKKNSPGGGLDNMMAYVDENGRVTDTPPDPTRKKEEIDASTIEIGIVKRDDIEVPSVREGRVDFFNDQKGFGFIKEKGTGEKYFVHVHGCVDQIAENDMVTFDLERGMKGMNAVDVKIIKS